MAKSSIEITWGKAPKWVKNAVKSCMQGKRPAHITVVVGTEFRLGQPLMDWSVVYYFARDPRGYVTEHRAATYRNILGSTKAEQMLYMGGKMTLKPGYQVLRIEHTGYKIYVNLYVHPDDFVRMEKSFGWSEPSLVGETGSPMGALTEDEKLVLATWKGFVSKYRPYALWKLAHAPGWDRHKVHTTAESLIRKGIFKEIRLHGKRTVRVTPVGSKYYRQHWSELNDLRTKYGIY